MARPYWMELGRVSPGGVPESLGYGRFRPTRQDRLRYARRMGERQSLSEWLRLNLHRGELSPAQKQCGARRIA